MAASAPRVLVTGATGFIAGYTVADLLAHGYKVRGTVRNTLTSDVAHLHAIAEKAGGDLEFVSADLGFDAGWGEAVDGCDAVLHMASPVPASVPKDADEIVGPAVDGTMRVLRAASGSVRRVVMTSSADAVVHGADHGDRLHTEADWSDPALCAPYPKSKTLAERAAWDFASTNGVELVVVNPGTVVGPLQHPCRPTSMEPIRMMLSHEIPAVPRLGFALVDVRDVATAHRLALETPAAAGNRYLVADDWMWMGEMAQVLRGEFGPLGYRVPTRPLPYALMWLVARFDKTVRLGLTYYGMSMRLDAAKAQRELGWTARPVGASLVEAGHSLIDLGVVTR